MTWTSHSGRPLPTASVVAHESAVRAAADPSYATRIGGTGVPSGTSIGTDARAGPAARQQYPPGSSESLPVHASGPRAARAPPHDPSSSFATRASSPRARSWGALHIRLAQLPRRSPDGWSIAEHAEGGIGRRRRRDADPCIDDEAFVGPDGERVQIELGDLGQIVGQMTDPDDGVDDGAAIHRWVAVRIEQERSSVDRQMLVAFHAGALLFDPHRNPPVDRRPVVDTIVRIGHLADDLPEVAELDLNPLTVGADECLVVDARIRVTPAPTTDPTLRMLGY